MSEFIIGQRWVSQSETDLGLGIITGVKGRRVSISFPAVDEKRTYASDSAPLTRIEHKPGDTLRTHDDVFAVVDYVEENEGLLIYHTVDNDGKQLIIDELDLSCYIELTSPKQRLLSGQLDNFPAYQLRCATLLQLNELQQSNVSGLLGSRTSLLAHQTYIAYEVASRYAPRVLLADEVGLGKTIEAGMILHYQLHTGLASRVLIIVPDTLMHQWLVEMLRRFNLQFALFNEERLQGLMEMEADNPFETEQLVICSLDDITSQPTLFKQALSATWDMLVVDEAHHLHYADGDTGHEYLYIEQLASQIRGLLLLTATPEQAGVTSHFARLRLLDPTRFHSLEQFKQEERYYKQLNVIVDQLLKQTNKPISSKLLQQIQQYLGEDKITTTNPNENERNAFITRLLDQHGTGRVFFRNTRDAISGFPERNLIEIPLPLPDCYADLQGKETLFPETHMGSDDWLKHDPRVQHLIDLLNTVNDEKVLVICANASTAIKLENYLQLRGIRTAAFYEGLSIIERDRAAAYFADFDMGAQMLICSEIGSEGRNFQFAHHLLLFDLPLNPDLLEQRIGRLDRIGQIETIRIHVPYLAGTAQQALFQWFKDGLGLFENSFSGAYAIYESRQKELGHAIETPDVDFHALITTTRTQMESVKDAMQKGRDRLIELNSCRKDIANELIEQIQLQEQPEQLMNYMEMMFDAYGVEHEDHSEHTWILQPGDHMRLGYFPRLGDDSITATFNRTRALSREDMAFITWEHPMVSESMDMVMNSEIGNAAIASIDIELIPAGTLLLETYSSIMVIAPKAIQAERYLPLTPVRTLISQDRKNYAKALSHEKLNLLCQKVNRQTSQQIIKQIKGELETMIDFAMQFANSKLPEAIQLARKSVDDLLGEELQRTKTLKQKNPSIRNEEIEFLEQRLAQCKELIDRSKYELQAVRLVIVQ